MAYNDLIARAAASPLIPEDAAKQIIKAVAEKSAALTRFRRVTMTRGQQRMPVASLLPMAYWVSGDTGLKQTSKMEWENKYLNAEELAVIIPVPDTVSEDAEFNVWDEIIPEAAAAIGIAFDAAVFLGIGKPASWDDDIATAAAAAGNTHARGTANAAAGGLAEDLNVLMGLVEADGYDVNGAFANRSYKQLLRSARDTTGQRLLDVSIDGEYSLFQGMVPLSFGGTSWTTGSGDPEAFVGDFSKGIVGIRRDIEWKIVDEGVISDGSGAVVFNFMQQDAQGIRMTFRGAFSVANPVTRYQPTEANRYPFGVMTHP